MGGNQPPRPGNEDSVELAARCPCPRCIAAIPPRSLRRETSPRADADTIRRRRIGSGDSLTGVGRMRQAVYASNLVTTLPPTSVNRASRPRNLKVNLV